MHLSSPCDLRPIQPLGVWSHQGWRLKLYAISYGQATVTPALVEATKAAPSRTLPHPATTADRYGVGFVGIHEGRGSNVVFVDWWANENELFHRLFVSTKAEPALLKPASQDMLTACVWDLRVLSHERDAWLATVLRNPKGPDLDAYLARTFTELA